MFSFFNSLYFTEADSSSFHSYGDFSVVSRVIPNISIAIVEPTSILEPIVDIQSDVKYNINELDFSKYRLLKWRTSWRAMFLLLLLLFFFPLRS